MVRKIFILMLAVIFIACQKSKENGELNSEILPLTPKAEINKESYAMIVDTPPGIIGGLEAIQKKIKYPDSAIKNGIEGTVYVMAYINENGEVDFAEVIKGIGYGCDEVARDAVLQMKFTSPYHQGKPAKARVVVPIRFKMRK
ncbi:energy transducer TonB [Candidatus Kryptobacter tengchongensis]|uniref:Protein TonB n=1 Tax=Kryptobacter tengchongensis TaxID=1643429 RepID=A0A916LL54_KRYT1|nr:energy transducer TonB [Candidatus Kryptobacter tengchongensis]CUT05003.1 protein TonB [Candidatus Kryptobacter tengchongensis]